LSHQGSCGCTSRASCACTQLGCFVCAMTPQSKQMGHGRLGCLLASCRSPPARLPDSGRRGLSAAEGAGAGGGTAQNHSRSPQAPARHRLWLGCACSCVDECRGARVCMLHGWWGRQDVHNVCCNLTALQLCPVPTCTRLSPLARLHSPPCRHHCTLTHRCAGR